MSASALLACLCGDDGLDGVDHQILQLQSLHQVSVPDQSTVGHLQPREDNAEGLCSLWVDYPGLCSVCRLPSPRPVFYMGRLPSPRSVFCM